MVEVDTLKKNKKIGGGGWGWGGMFWGDGQKGDWRSLFGFVHKTDATFTECQTCRLLVGILLLLFVYLLFLRLLEGRG